MGLWEFLRQWPQRRRVGGAILSVGLHALLVVAVLWPFASARSPMPKGDALVVELRDAKETAAAGLPAASSQGPGPREGEPASPAPPPRRAAPRERVERPA
ncbi:MAG TPA: hypothetical protein VNN07_02060, partial [Candidatus Tectomicrobia bacterium]|nr:hypothetical protein [Candidatus Tectomicrobia bacterium]